MNKVKDFIKNNKWVVIFFALILIGLLASFAVNKNIDKTDDIVRQDYPVQEKEHTNAINTLPDGSVDISKGYYKDGFLCMPDEGPAAQSEDDIPYLNFIYHVPAYEGENEIDVNGDVPLFLKNAGDLREGEFCDYSELDELGRTGASYANLKKEYMPEEDRDFNISNIKPSGWHTANVKTEYGVVFKDDSFYLFNRCHQIAWCLGGNTEFCNTEKNLFTGTRECNLLMKNYEVMVVRYIENTGNHVQYRVTPVYEGNNLIATGVLMEMFSIEDQGIGINHCKFIYNVQPGFEINYATGDYKLVDKDLASQY